MQLKYKISISIMLISLFILIFISIFYANWSYKNTLENEKNQLKEKALESAKYIEIELLDKLDLLKTIASAPIVSSYLIQKNQEYDKFTTIQKEKHINALNQKWIESKTEKDSFVKPYLNNELAMFLKKQQEIFAGMYGELFITNGDGAMVASTAKLTTLAHANKYWWRESFANGDGKIFFDDRGFDSSANGYVIGVVYPIKKDGKILGILKANINIMNTLSFVVNRYNKKGDGYLKIVRTKGLVVYEEGKDLLSSTIQCDLLKNLKNLEHNSKILQNNLVAFAPVRLSLDSQEIIFGGKPHSIDHLKGNDDEIWHTVICFDKNKALAQSKETSYMIFYIGVMLIILSGFIAYMVGKWISRPIEELQATQQKLKVQEEIMIAQARHAAMGEMISMIAHQWRQPISAISMGANNILADIQLQTIEENSLKEDTQKILTKTKELSKTIDRFKNFFQSEKNISRVDIKNIIEDSSNVIEKSLQSYNIKLDKNISSQMIETYSRELMQVFISILKNSQEMFLRNKIDDAKISIFMKKLENSVIISFCDNAGGIEESIMSKIFNPYFSTKNEKNGVGLGLYMSKTIVEKHLNGIINVKNIALGVCVEIELPYLLEKGENDE